MCQTPGEWRAGFTNQEADYLKDVLMQFLDHKNGKYSNGKDLLDGGKVGDLEGQDGGTGIFHAGVQGTEMYQVKVTLLPGGQWQDTACTCPDGNRSTGKCKHVAAVILKAWATEDDVSIIVSSNVSKKQDSKKQVNAAICIDDDDDPPPVQSTARSSASRADAKDIKDKTPAAAAAAVAAAPASLTTGERGDATITKGPAKAKGGARQLPSWLMDGAGVTEAKPAGRAAQTAAKVAAIVAGEAKAKPAAKKRKKTADAGDSPGDEQAAKAPRAARGTAKAGTAKGKAAAVAKISSVADIFEDDEGLCLLDELLAAAGEAASPPRAIQKVEEVPDEVHISHSSQDSSKDSPTSAVPDTPEPTPPSSLNAANNISGASSVPAKRPLVTDSDKDADDVDSDNDAEKVQDVLFAKLRAKISKGNISQSNSQSNLQNLDSQTRAASASDLAVAPPQPVYKSKPAGGGGVTLWGGAS